MPICCLRFCKKKKNKKQKSPRHNAFHECGETNRRKNNNDGLPYGPPKSPQSLPAQNEIWRNRNTSELYYVRMLVKNDHSLLSKTCQEAQYDHVIYTIITSPSRMHVRPFDSYQLDSFMSSMDLFTTNCERLYFIHTPSKKTDDSEQKKETAIEMTDLEDVIPADVAEQENNTTTETVCKDWEYI